MYNMKACIGRDLAGPIARSHARFCFKAAYDAAISLGDRPEPLLEECVNPGGCAIDLHLLCQIIINTERKQKIIRNFYLLSLKLL